MPNNNNSSNGNSKIGLSLLADTEAPKETPKETPMVDDQTPKLPEKSVEKKVETSRAIPSVTTPSGTTKSSFKVGDSKYNIIADNNSARNLIKWDDDGNIAADSPVQVIGKNANGGFILAASEGASGVNASSFPYSKDTGINFPSLESDVGGSAPLMQSIHGGSYSDFSEVANPKAAAALRGIYKRTGRF